MEDRETASVAAVWFGIIVLVASLTADRIGIGYAADFGPFQALGTILGAVVIIVGLFLTLWD